MSSMHFLQVEAKLRGWNRIVADVSEIMEQVTMFGKKDLRKKEFEKLIRCLDELAVRGLFYLATKLPIAKLVLLPLALNQYPAKNDDELLTASKAMHLFETVVRNAVVSRKILDITRDGMESCIWFLYMVGVEELVNQTDQWSVHSVAKAAGLIDKGSGLYTNGFTDSQLIVLSLFDPVAQQTLLYRRNQ